MLKVLQCSKIALRLIKPKKLPIISANKSSKKGVRSKKQ